MALKLEQNKKSERYNAKQNRQGEANGKG